MEEEIKDEILTNEVQTDDSYMIPVEALNEFQKCICNVIIEKGLGTGFLVKILRKEKEKEQKKKFYCLITSEHIIDEKIIKKNTNILIKYDYHEKNHKELSIEINRGTEDKRFIRSHQYLGVDATVVQIYEDEIQEKYFYFFDDNILEISKDFNQNYEKYEKKQIFIFQIPGKDNNLTFSTGNILSRKNLNTFDHNSSTHNGSSGSPILLYSENKINIIGIHKGGYEKKKLNAGNFIGELIESLISNRNYIELKDYFIGEVIENWHKKGNFFLNNNEHYIGEIWKNKFHGKGTLYKNKKTIIYYGEFAEGEYNGKGTLFLDDGKYYKGKFVKNKREGKGILYNKEDKIIYEGEFKEDKYDGYGKLYYGNGESFEGQFSKGEKTEEGKEIKVNENLNEKAISNLVNDFFDKFQPLGEKLGINNTCENCTHSIYEHFRVEDSIWECKMCGKKCNNEMNLSDIFNFFN